ncbi:hypothetical protein EDF24_1914 [Curtobacterium sp. PhB130]|uniref:hypothetical protein n=1 Tax=unclassified Curtobacterium TaxID=257496 RepID=UPI000FB3F030|nr:MULTISPECIES: hypothetical protein [unclassified Curtobacterium]ROP60353.1 hypothetical protein EDF55_3361 [Curtobacterium sp. ZW137]ROS76325.1 hypothetical protein EDF24_1914 [Curtobacterium sp. PhB130]TCK59656.1 hypothetical protein EDF27_3518 [Curtobacterium sp. PhB136]
MPRNSDAVLLESVATHRRRLRQAFVLGRLADRRQVNDNVRRFIGSVVLAAVVGVGCLGYSFVTTALAKQAAQQATTSGIVSSTAPSTSTSTGSTSTDPTSTDAPEAP